jgi:hypothetical protein
LLSGTEGGQEEERTHLDAAGGVVADVDVEEDDGASDTLWCVERSHGECDGRSERDCWTQDDELSIVERSGGWRLLTFSD